MNQAMITEIVKALPMKEFFNLDWLEDNVIEKALNENIDKEDDLSVICNYTWGYLVSVNASPIDLGYPAPKGLTFNSFEHLVKELEFKFNRLDVVILSYVYKAIFLFEKKVKIELIKTLRNVGVNEVGETESNFLHFSIYTDKAVIFTYLKEHYDIDLSELKVASNV